MAISTNQIAYLTSTIEYPTNTKHQPLYTSYKSRCLFHCYNIEYYLSIDYSAIQGMVTVGHMMAQVTRNKVTLTDPVSSVLFKQFKQVSCIKFTFVVFFCLFQEGR